MSCCLYRVVLEERPSVRVKASAVDDSSSSSKCGQNNSDFSEDIVTP